MIGERWSTTIRNAAILAEPKGPTVCSCGAPGGSAHDHNTGQQVMVFTRVCSYCKIGYHTACKNRRNRCVCADGDHVNAR